VGTNKEQGKAALDSLLTAVYESAKHGFTVPGLDKVVTQKPEARIGETLQLANRSRARQSES